MNARPTESEPLLTPAEVAAMFRVDPKTVTRWAKAGKRASPASGRQTEVASTPEATCRRVRFGSHAFAAA